MKKGIQVLMAVLLVVLSGCGNEKKTSTVQPVTLQADLNKLSEGPQLVRQEKAANWPFRKIESLNDLDPEENKYEKDIRFTDTSSIDFTDVDMDLLTYDSGTVWPQTLPEHYDLEKVTDLGKDPGLGVRTLHEQGITGKGVNIAIIDQGLLLDHEEYKGKIKLYELLHSYDRNAMMHGAAVTSIAIGNNIGVAPDANLYYISDSFWDYDEETKEMTTNLSYMAESIHRIIEINEKLPVNDKIAVLSISRGFYKDEDPDVYEAIEEAKKEGIFVITTAMSENYKYSLYGLTRPALSDPNDVASYECGRWGGGADILKTQDVLFAPMDHRTTAGPFSKDDYAHYSSGGLSWTAPWLAGMYALCKQVDPELSGEDFLEAAALSGDTYDFGTEDTYEYFHEIINPSKLIQYIEEHK